MTVGNITHLFENCIRFAEGLVSNEQAEFGREVDKLLTFCTKAQTVQLNSFFHYHLGQTIMNEPSKICGRQPFKNLKGYGTFNFFVSICSARSTDKDTYYSQNMAQTGYKAVRIPILTHF